MSHHDTPHRPEYVGKPVAKWTPADLVAWAADRTLESAERYDREPGIGGTGATHHAIARRLRGLAERLAAGPADDADRRDAARYRALRGAVESSRVAVGDDRATLRHGDTIWTTTAADVDRLTDELRTGGTA